MASPRCTERGCPVRYRAGRDRPCPQHQDGHRDQDRDAFDETFDRMAEFMASTPGGDGAMIG